MDRMQIALKTIALLTESLKQAEDANDMRVFFTLLGLLRREIDSLNRRKD